MVVRLRYDIYSLRVQERSGRCIIDAKRGNGAERQHTPLALSTDALGRWRVLLGLASGSSLRGGPSGAVRVRETTTCAGAERVKSVKRGSGPLSRYVSDKRPASFKEFKFTHVSELGIRTRDQDDHMSTSTSRLLCVCMYTQPPVRYKTARPVAFLWHSFVHPTPDTNTQTEHLRPG